MPLTPAELKLIERALYDYAGRVNDPDTRSALMDLRGKVTKS
ncbi:MAG: hypothetical protein ACKO0Z_06830 [Betaproteobacteria bacterium]